MAEPESDAATLLRDALEASRRAGDFPSYQALVTEGGRTLFSCSAGLAVLEPSIEANDDTLYDLASLTKPLITAMLALHLAEDGVLPLDVPVGRLLDFMSTPALDQVTVLDLLTHRAGFEPWAPLYLEAPPSLDRYARAAAQRPLRYARGTDVVYSDLGFLILGSVIEAATGSALAKLARRIVLDPVAGDTLAYPVTPELRERCAATEKGNVFERKLAGKDESARGFRSDLIWGSVHDGNAWGLGGVGPHAGLFGTARGVARLAAEWCDGLGPRTEVLGAASRALGRMDLTPFASSHRTAAFELAAGDGTAASGVLDGESFGHTGFTGTSVWIEPRRGRVYVLLTNRVHPCVKAINMNEIRRRFHCLASRLTS